MGDDDSQTASRSFLRVVAKLNDVKRTIRRYHAENPPKVCDKLFVPPNMADAINKAVHGVS